MSNVFVGFIIFILLLAVIGLAVGLAYLYKHPENTTIIPYNIYGGPNGVIAPGRFAQGILTQVNNFVQTTAISDVTKETSQWYFVPSAGQVLLQNVSSKEYIVVNDTTLVVNTTASMTDATPFTWQIDQVDGGNFFVYHNTTLTSCTSHFFYLSFASVGTGVAILCISSSPTGFKWAVAPIIANLVG